MKKNADKFILSLRKMVMEKELHILIIELQTEVEKE